jgi:AcrR family transcriptional regulator
VARRDEILLLAKAQIAERGYSDTSMRDIAEASGLLAGSLYSHFRSKAALVGEIVVRFYDELLPVQRAILASDADGADQLREMIGAVYRVCDTHREELTILHYDWHSLSTLDELADVQSMSLETLDLWERAVERGKRDGSLLPGVESTAMVRIATSSIHALIDTVRYASHPIPKGRSEQLAAILQDVLLGGVATVRPEPVAPATRARRSTARPKQPATK